jgi:hypothetical protein
MKKLTLLALTAIVFASCKTYLWKDEVYVCRYIKIGDDKKAVYLFNAGGVYDLQIQDSMNKWNIGDTLKFK